MAKHEGTEKPKKRRSRAGIVILVFLLILAGIAGYLYYSIVKAPLTLDDPRKMADSSPMSAEDRFRIFPAEQMVQVKVDAADFWNVILTHTDQDFLEIINQELSSYGLSVSGCAIHVDEAGPRLDLELFYQDIRLVAKIPCALEAQGKHFSLNPTDVKLGVIPLPVKGLLSSVKLEYDVTLPIITEVKEVSFAEDAILFTGPMEEDVRALVPLEKTLYQTAVFRKSLQPIVDSLIKPDGFADVLSYLEQNPGSMEALYRDLFILAGPDATAEYLDSRLGLTQRFFPGIDFDDVAKEQLALTEELKEQSLVLEKFFTNLVNDYNEKKFTLSNGEFLQKKKPFQAAQYAAGKYDSLFDWLDPETFFLILVDAEDGFIRKTSSFYRIADENQEFTQSVDFNKTYILGCVLRSVDGDPFLLYDTEIDQDNSYVRSIKLMPLSEEDVQQLQVPGKFGVWTG